MGGKFAERGQRKSGGKAKAPLERLERCHRRLEERLEDLRAGAALIAGARQRDAGWQVVSEVLDYLQRAIGRHEEDEEISVFPRLAEHPELHALLETLTAEHRVQRGLVDALAKLVQGRRGADACRALPDLAEALSHSYRDHIRREDAELLPAIARLIGPAEQAQLATEMSERRG